MEPTLQGAGRFAVTQQITLSVNRCDIRALDAGGALGELLATRSRSGWRSRIR